MNRIHSMYRILPRLVTALIVGLGVTLDADAQNRPPTTVGYITSINLAINQSTSFGVSGYFSDPDNDALEYSLKEDSTGLVSASISGSRVTLTAGSTTGSTGKIIVTATDPGGLDVSQDFNVTVYVPTPNRAPVTEGYITSINLAINGSTSFGVSGYFSDPDNDALKYSLSGGDSGLVSASISGSRVTLTAGSTPGNTGKIFVTATDPDGLNATQDFDVGVYDPDEVSYVTVSPSSATIEEGDTQGFSAAAYNAVSEAISGKTFTWSSSNTAVATIVSSTGVATGKKAGTATIKATVDGVSDTATLRVDKVEVSPSSATIEEGATKQFTASLKSGGSATFRWRSSNTAVATVNSSGVATGKKAGSVTITATANGLSDTATLRVDKVEVSPSSATIEEGATKQFTASLKSGGSATFRWRSSDTNIATINSSGVATGKKAGSVTITATANGLSDTATLRVDKVEVSPSSATIEEGATKQFTASLKSGGSATFRWRSSDTNIATINSSGVATGKKAGSVTITATANGLSDTATLRVDKVEVSPSSATIEEGATKQFTASLKSGGSATFRWRSSDTNIATINSSGVATGKKAGSVTITATANGLSDTATLRVDKVEVSPSSATIEEGATKQFTASLKSGGSATFRWRSSDTNIATINSSGLATGKKAGTVTITATANGLSDTATLRVTEVSPTPVLSISDASARESAGTISFSVTMNKASSDAVSVDYATKDGTATAGNDYTSKSGTLRIEPNSTSGTISVTINDDQVHEGNENFTVTLSNAVNATIGTAAATGTIEDDEPPPPPDSVAVSPLSTTLTAIGDTAQLSAKVFDADGNTISNASIEWSSNRKSVATVSTSGLVTAVGNGTATITAKATTNEGSASGNATVTVEEPPPDADPEVSISNASALESAGTISFSVTMNKASSDAVSVDYATKDGTATAGDDYTSKSGTLRIEPNSTSGTISVTINDDQVHEGNENFTVTLSNAVNATIGTAAATGTIEDDEPPPPPSTDPEVSISNASAGESARTISFSVTMNKTSSDTVSVDYATKDGTATAGNDYTSKSGTLRIEPGSTSGTISVTINDDQVHEGNENLTVTLSNAVNATIGTAAATGTIEDDDPTDVVSSISVTPNPAFVEKDGTKTFTAAAFTSGNVAIPGKTFTWSSGNTAVATIDSSTGVATGVSAGTATIKATVDGVSGTATLTVTVPPLVVGLFASPGVVSEGAGPTTITVRLNPLPHGRSFATDQTVPVSVSDNGGSNAVGFAAVEDFDVTIPAGAASGSGEFTLTPVDDGTHTDDGKVRVSASAPGIIVTSSDIKLVDDDDPVISISAVSDTVSEGTAVVFTLTASPAPATSLTVNLSLSGGSGFLTGLPPLNATVEAGSSAATVRFPTGDDVVDEPDGAMTVQVIPGDGYSVGASSSAQVVVQDDDAPPSGIALAVSPTRVTESDGATTVTVTASPTGGTLFGLAQTVRVSVTGSGTANAVGFSAVADFDVSIPAGLASGRTTFTLSPVDNTVDNADETITIKGAASPSGTPVAPATLALEDDDEATEITIAAVSDTVVEGASVEFTLTASPAPATSLTVNLSSSGGDGFLTGPLPTSATVDAGASTATVSVSTGDDTVDEADGTVTVQVSPGAGYLVGASSSAQVVVQDNDDAPSGIALATSPATVSESDGATTVTVTASPTGGTLFGLAQTVRVSVSGSGTANAVGFSAVADFDVPIPAGAASGSDTFTLTPTDNAQDNADETITIKGAASPSGTPVAPATLTLEDDDVPEITIATAADAVSEGTAVVFTLTASPAPATSLTVNLSSSGGDGFLTGPLPTSATVDAGASTATVSVSTGDDTVDEADGTVTVQVSPGAGYLVGASSSAQVVVQDNDDAPSGIALAASPATVSESDGATTVTVTASPTGGTLFGLAQTVRVSVTGSGTANAVGFSAVFGGLRRGDPRGRGERRRHVHAYAHRQRPGQRGRDGDA